MQTEIPHMEKTARMNLRETL